MGKSLVLLCFMGVSIPIGFGRTSTEPPPARKPNILLIVADDLGYADLGCQGGKEIPTPHIDSLANNGVRFTSGYVSGPYCSPTRAGLLTGRYQQRFGHEFNPGPAQQAQANFGLPLTETTLPQLLRQAGYATGMFGKWHLGYKPEFHPLKRGFEEYFGFLGGAHSYRDARADSANPILDGAKVVDQIDYTTDEFAKRSADFIRRKKGTPWFCYLPFNAVHAPMQGLDRYRERFPNLKDRRQTFACMLAAMDDGVGTVLEAVQQNGEENDTLILFISDNGGPTAVNTSLNSPLRGFKAQTWEGGVRVPFLLQWKGKIPPGKVEDRPAIQLDLFTTALSAAEVKAPADKRVDGVDLVPFLRGKRGPIHEALYWRFGKQMAIRMGDWKLVKAPGGSANLQAEPRGARVENAELFNLKDDMGETKNLAGEKVDVVERLTRAWNSWNAELIDPKWGGGAAGNARQRQQRRRIPASELAEL